MMMKNTWLKLIALLVLMGALSSAFAQTILSDRLLEAGSANFRFWVDINADGKDDFCGFFGASLERMDCYLATGSGFAAAKSFTNIGSGGTQNGIKWADVNGDGYIDLCRSTSAPFYSESGYWYAFTCYLGPNFTQTSTTQIPIGIANLSQVYMVDINGDGRSDICYLDTLTDTYLKCKLAIDINPATRVGFSEESAAWTSAKILRGEDAYPHNFYDFNGDGTPDFCRINRPQGMLCLLIKPTGITRTEPITSVPDLETSGAAFVDINGDGNIDYCGIKSNTIRCILSDGISWRLTTAWQSEVLDAGDSRYRYWADVNGDGIADFCRVINSSPPQMMCRISKGSASSSTSPSVMLDVMVNFASADDVGLSDGGRGFCDPTGSGYSTYCRLIKSTPIAAGQQCYEGESGLYCAQTQTGTWALKAGLTDTVMQARPPLLTAFSDGLGAQTRVTYLSMSSADVYTHSPSVPGNGYPRAVVALGGHSPLVYESRVWRISDSTPLSGNARYFYKDLRNDPLAGSRGFRERWIFTESSNTLDHVINYQGLGPSVDASSVLNDLREIGQVKYQERFLVMDSLVPTPANATALSARQVKLNAIGLAARTLSTVAPGAPSTNSPFILLQTTSNTLGDTTPANPRLRYVANTVTRAWDLAAWGPIALPQSETATLMDAGGNVTQLVQKITQPDGTLWRQITTNNTYADDTSKWLLGRLTKSSVITQAASVADQLALYSRSAGNSPGAADVSSTVPAARDSLPPTSLNTILQIFWFND